MIIRFIRLFVLSSSILMFSACDKVAENPGDFSVKSELKLLPEVISVDGTKIPMEVQEMRDTTYRHPYTVADTLKNSAGEPVLNEQGQLQIKRDTLYHLSKITAKYIIMKPIELDSKADTFTINLLSNARWSAPVPSALGRTQWFFNYNLLTGGTTIAGSGDGVFNFRVYRNRGKKRRNDAIQYFTTADSTVLYKVVFQQKGERDKPSEHKN